jgi:hypothetical protein
VIGRAMVADRSQRYKTADELRVALDTLRRRQPGEAPQTLPFAGTIPVELMANAAPRAVDTTSGGLAAGGGTGAEQAMTGAPLSHTKAESAGKGRGGVVGAILAGVALVGVAAAVMLTRGSSPGHDATGETLKGDREHGAKTTATAAGPVVEPTLLLTATATAAPAPSASVTAAAKGSAGPKVDKPHGKTRAAEHGLSEQNPF